MAKKMKAVSRQIPAVRDLSVLLKDSPAGAWVALSHDKTHFVGTAKSIEAASLQAQVKGDLHPILKKIPLENEGIAAGVK